ncbi:hypothetical protein SAY86_026620 [Trapa natans]|uniref:2Fe-2S ferredoxin-type domain-containing protein n=1 Tax=Trapa natans TaxID=22666 RepID=A0AAN7QHX6_TRANT|nr:hypothetical protein SAY86_026620 [Trapa natans]
MVILSSPPCTSFFIDRTPEISLSRRYFSLSFPSPLVSKHSRRVSSELHTTSVGSGNGTANSYSVSVPTHKVTVHDRQRGVVHEFVVPEDQYILHTAESQNITLPFACRHGCCTSCAVRVKSGQINQPEALGISAELKSKGYALLCVGFPVSDLEVETQDEDEVRVQYQTLSVAANPGIMSPFVCVSFFLVKYYWHLQVYWLQFGRYFARGPIERDDYALELAMADE